MFIIVRMPRRTSEADQNSIGISFGSLGNSDAIFRYRSNILENTCRRLLSFLEPLKESAHFSVIFPCSSSHDSHKNHEVDQRMAGITNSDLY